MVEKEKGIQIKVLRFDEGGKYFLDEFNDYVKEQGIQRKYSCKFTPQQNGAIERKNKHIAEFVRAMLNEKRSLIIFGPKAISIDVYIMSKTPTTIVHCMMLEEKYTRTKPYILHLKVFGCIAYVDVPNERRTKLGSGASLYIKPMYHMHSRCICKTPYL